MTQVEVIVKGELHTSRGDLAHERELLVEGVDHLVLEGPEERAEYGWFQSWFATAMMITEYLFFRPLYADSSILRDLADAQGATVRRTRESDASVLENSHVIVRFGAAILFFALLMASALYGLRESHLYGATFLIGSGLVPVLVLRIHESSRSLGSRDEKIAELISEAAEEGGRVIAVVGDDHADSVCEYLPDRIDPERLTPRYSTYSWRHAKDIAYPTFVFISVLWVCYTAFVAYARFAVGLN